MAKPTTFVCGGAPIQGRGRRIVSLSKEGPDANVDFHAEDIGRKMLAAVSPVIADLLDIAAYVHCADQSVSRGGGVAERLGADWHREMHFVVPVRQPDRWSAPDARKGLERLLSFMSGDNFRFEFVPLGGKASTAEYLDFRTEADQVALFSGGLDSLTGAVDHLSHRSGRLLLASHQSSSKIARKQRDLVRDLNERFPGRVIHVPVRVTKKGVATVETTQRTRSFLFGSIAAAVAEISGAGQINVFENGIVSLNLPVSAQVVGTAATRTTHPRVLHLMTDFLSTLMERPLTVANPYLWKTKSDVAAILAGTPHADLAKYTVSCSHVHEMSHLHTHCGRCSQCLDRRFGALAGGLGDEDPAEMYEVDLLTGPREKPLDVTMAELFVRHALAFRDMSEAGLLSRFGGEIARVSSVVPGMRPDAVTRAVLDLQRRHGNSVASVLEAGFRQHAAALAAQGLPESCVLRLVAGPNIPATVVSVPTEPAPAGNAARDFHRSSQIRIAVDAEADRVLVDGCSSIEGAAAFRLISSLVQVAQKNVAEGRAPEHREFSSAGELSALLGVTETSLRRCILRVRQRLSKEFEELYGLALSGDALVENSPWRGYRLNPSVLILAPGEVKPGRHRHVLEAPSSRGTAAA